MKAELRDDDIIGRVGGEEFAAVLRNNNREAIEAVTGRLLQRIVEAGREVDGDVGGADVKDAVDQTNDNADDDKPTKQNKKLSRSRCKL